MNQPLLLEVKVDEKYTVRQEKTGGLSVTRHGEPWLSSGRDVFPSKLILAMAQRIEALTNAGIREDQEVCQILGKALGYPLPQEGGDKVVTADHVAVTIAQEAASRIEKLEAVLRDITDLELWDEDADGRLIWRGADFDPILIRLSARGRGLGSRAILGC